MVKEAVLTLYLSGGIYCIITLCMCDNLSSVTCIKNSLSVTCTCIKILGLAQLSFHPETSYRDQYLLCYMHLFIGCDMGYPGPYTGGGVRGGSDEPPFLVAYH